MVSARRGEGGSSERAGDKFFPAGLEFRDFKEAVKSFLDADSLMKICGEEFVEDLLIQLGEELINKEHIISTLIEALRADDNGDNFIVSNLSKILFSTDQDKESEWMMKKGFGEADYQSDEYVVELLKEAKVLK